MNQPITCEEGFLEDTGEREFYFYTAEGTICAAISIEKDGRVAWICAGGRRGSFQAPVKEVKRTEREQALRDAAALAIREQRSVDQINVKFEAQRLAGFCMEPTGYEIAHVIKCKLMAAPRSAWQRARYHDTKEQ